MSIPIIRKTGNIQPNLAPPTTAAKSAQMRGVNVSKTPPNINELTTRINNLHATILQNPDSLSAMTKELSATTHLWLKTKCDKSLDKNLVSDIDNKLQTVRAVMNKLNGNPKLYSINAKVNVAILMSNDKKISPQELVNTLESQKKELTLQVKSLVQQKENLSEAELAALKALIKKIQDKINENIKKAKTQIQQTQLPAKTPPSSRSPNANRPLPQQPSPTASAPAPAAPKKTPAPRPPPPSEPPPSSKPNARTPPPQLSQKATQPNPTTFQSTSNTLKTRSFTVRGLKEEFIKARSQGNKTSMDGIIKKMELEKHQLDNIARGIEFRFKAGDFTPEETKMLLDKIQTINKTLELRLPPTPSPAQVAKPLPSDLPSALPSASAPQATTAKAPATRPPPPSAAPPTSPPPPVPSAKHETQSASAPVISHDPAKELQDAISNLNESIKKLKKGSSQSDFTNNITKLIIQLNLTKAQIQYEHKGELLSIINEAIKLAKKSKTDESQLKKLNLLQAKFSHSDATWKFFIKVDKEINTYQSKLKTTSELKLKLENELKEMDESTGRTVLVKNLNSAQRRLDLYDASPEREQFVADLKEVEKKLSAMALFDLEQKPNKERKPLEGQRLGLMAAIHEFDKRKGLDREDLVHSLHFYENELEKHDKNKAREDLTTKIREIATKQKSQKNTLLNFKKTVGFVEQTPPKVLAKLEKNNSKTIKDFMENMVTPFKGQIQDSIKKADSSFEKILKFSLNPTKYEKMLKQNNDPIPILKELDERASQSQLWGVTNAWINATDLENAHKKQPSTADMGKTLQAVAAQIEEGQIDLRAKFHKEFFLADVMITHFGNGLIKPLTPVGELDPKQLDVNIEYFKRCANNDQKAAEALNIAFNNVFNAYKRSSTDYMDHLNKFLSLLEKPDRYKEKEYEIKPNYEAQEII